MRLNNLLFRLRVLLRRILIEISYNNFVTYRVIFSAFRPLLRIKWISADIFLNFGFIYDQIFILNYSSFTSKWVDISSFLNLWSYFWELNRRFKFIFFRLFLNLNLWLNNRFFDFYWVLNVWSGFWSTHVLFWISSLF